MGRIMTANFRGGEEPEFVVALRKKVRDDGEKQAILDNAARDAASRNDRTALLVIQRKQRILDREMDSTVKKILLWEGSV